MTPLLIVLVIVLAFLAYLVGMAWWPKLRHRYLTRIDEEQAADTRTAWKRMDTGMWTGGRRG